MQELGDEFGVSKVTVFEHVAALQRKGLSKAFEAQGTLFAT